MTVIDDGMTIERKMIGTRENPADEIMTTEPKTTGIEGEIVRNRETIGIKGGPLRGMLFFIARVDE